MYSNVSKKYTEESLFLRFFRESTIHGVKYLSQRKRTSLERIIWILVLLGSCGASAYFIYEIFAKWKVSPVIVTFQPFQTSVMDVPFPSVTICSANRFRKSTFEKYLRESSSDDEEKSHLAKLVLRQLDHICSLSNTYSTYFNYSIHETTVNACERIGVGCGNHSGIPVHHKFSDEVLLGFAVAFPTCEDMMPLCVWEGERLYDCWKIFTRSITDMGFCCTFNSMPTYFLLKSESNILSPPVDNVTGAFWTNFKMDELLQGGNNAKYADYLRFQSKAGQGSGFSFLLNTDMDEYFCDNHDSYGFRIHMHSQIDHPHVAEYGVAVAPGLEMFINLQPEITRAEADIKDLHVDRRECYYSDEHPLDSFHFYSASNCLDQCLSEEIAKQCNCVRFDLGLKFSTGLKNLTYCEGHAFKCARRVMANVSKIGTVKVCPTCLPSCNTIEYTPQLSSLPLSKDFTIDVVTDEGEDGNGQTNVVRPNASIVHIFFGSDNIYSRVRKNLYSFNDFFAHIGGILGLFLGLSVLSVLEPINMIFWKFFGKAGNKVADVKSERFYGQRSNYVDKIHNHSIWRT